MNLVLMLTFSIAGLLFFGTGYALHRWRPEDRRSRWWYLPPLLLWMAFCVSFLKWLNVPHLDWNAARLTVGVAWGHGTEVFTFAGDGPFLCAAYGPLMPILYSPAALFKTPTVVLLAGGFLSVLYFFVPAFVLLWPKKDDDPDRRMWSFCTIALCVMLTHILAGLNYQAYAIHVDGAAIGFCVLACWCLLRRQRPDDLPWLWLSATCIVLAGSCKQIAAPIAIVLPCYVWILNGWRTALRYAVLLGITAVAFALLWHLIFDLRTVWYCIVTVPLRFPKGPEFFENLYNVGKKIKWTLPWLVAGCFFGVGSLRATGGLRNWLRQPWVLLFLAGVAVAPTSIRAMQVYNGSTNSLHCQALWMLSFCLLFREHALEMKSIAFRQVAKTVLILMMVVTFVVAGLKHYRRVKKEARGAYFENRREQAYRCAKAYPGQFLFPWEPLSTLLADGRAYHFDYGIHAQELAKQTVDRKTQLDPFVPPQLRAIVYIPNQKRYLLAHYPEYSRRVVLPELPGFEVFIRASDPGFDRPPSGNP